MSDNPVSVFPNTTQIVDEMAIQEDDPEFDLLNDETFGQGIADDDEDWETQHEKLSKEYNKENRKENKQENNQHNNEANDEEVDTNGISERMVQFVLSESEGNHNAEPRQDNFRSFGPFDNVPRQYEGENRFPDDGRWNSWLNPAPTTQLLPKILTVEELERDLPKPIANKNGNVTRPGAAAAQPSTAMMQRAATPNYAMPAVHYNYNRVPPPSAIQPVSPNLQQAASSAVQQPTTSTIIQRRPVNMMSMVQPMAINYGGPMQPRFPPRGGGGGGGAMGGGAMGGGGSGGGGMGGGGSGGGGFMPLNANAARPPPAIQPNERHDFFVRFDGRTQQGHNFDKRRHNPRDGPSHQNDPFSRDQRMYRHQPSQNAQNMFEDEYANLMTIQEKNWLAQIQQYQLNTMNPSRDDYYFTTFMNRKQGSSNRKNNNYAGNSRSVRETTPKPAYAPLQFENSLGKLQVGSVLAPRKIIDIDVVENIECSNQPVIPTTKQLLMEIEIMHNYVLQMEECDTAGVACALIPDCANKIVNHIIAHGRFNPYMNIHKGRQVVRRLLPFVSNTCPILNKMVVSMVSLSKKCSNGDNQQLLLSFLPYIRCWLANIDLTQLIVIAMQVESSLPNILTNKFTISVLANMVERAEHLFERTGEIEVKWNEFIIMAVGQMDSVGRRLERPVVGIDPLILRRHLVRCTGLRYENLTLAIKTLSNQK